MKKQRQQELTAYFTALAVVSITAVVWYLLIHAEEFGAIGSDEIDRYLYKRLDIYEQTFKQAPDLAQLMNQALTNPDRMTLDQRRQYLSHERRFFEAWDAAFDYMKSGDLDQDRFDVWDEWYVNELRRRPDFAWDENRQYFSDQFVAHVDRVMQEP